MTKAIRIQQPGGPEAMQLTDVLVGEPQPGEIRVKHHAIGINYIDVYHRTGLYPQPLPAGIGMEAAGVVEAVGEGVDFLKPGDRVAYSCPPTGAYAEARVMPAKQVVKLPDGISFETGAAMMLKGLTVQYLLRRTFKLEKHHVALFHAAAGGVGQIACQWAKAIGATLIATAGSDEKCALAKKLGATHVINYRSENFVERVKALTNGQGVDVVYDSVGKDTWSGSLDCLKPFGMMVSFGSASGPVPPFSVSDLGAKGSLYVTRPTLFTHIAKREVLEEMAADLFAQVESGVVTIHIEQRYPLAEVRRAHVDLESRKTIGSSVLIP
jgi:NADPH2:quinone reductase